MTFFTLYFLHIIFFEIAAWVVVTYWGIGWVPYILAAMLLATGQVCHEELYSHIYHNDYL